MYTNDFTGKKQMVRDLAEVYKKIAWSDIADIELKKYRHRNNGYEEEFILLTWLNGAVSTAPNNMNSLSATAWTIARMLDGGVYENTDYYKDVMNSSNWVEVMVDGTEDDV